MRETLLREMRVIAGSLTNPMLGIGA
jgi:hypothetical protein